MAACEGARETLAFVLGWRDVSGSTLRRPIGDFFERPCRVGSSIDSSPPSARAAPSSPSQGRGGLGSSDIAAARQLHVAVILMAHEPRRAIGRGDGPNKPHRGPVRDALR